MSNIIISTKRDPEYEEFAKLMSESTQRLNEIAVREEKMYLHAKPDAVENMVYAVMSHVAEGTLFEDTIRLVSGHKFPDILAGNFYGTEVKSTKSNKWESFGNSIFENTRIQNVKRIYLTFGKMEHPISFISKPYEECISGIVVDHSPRYHIDMQIQENGKKTIFEDMATSYDTFRKLPDKVQVDMIAKKSKEKLKDSESLWWHPDIEEYIAPPSIRLLSTFSKEEKEQIIAEAYCFFPELFSNSSKKYNRYILWLITDKNIATGSARDGFSAGGQVSFIMDDGTVAKVPATIGRLVKYRHMIHETIMNTQERILMERWRVSHIDKDRLSQWINIIVPFIVTNERVDSRVITQILCKYF